MSKMMEIINKKLILFFICYMYLLEENKVTITELFKNTYAIYTFKEFDGINIIKFISTLNYKNFRNCHQMSEQLKSKI